MGTLIKTNVEPQSQLAQDVIDSLKQARQELEVRNHENFTLRKQYERIFMDAPDAYFVMAYEDGRIMECNLAAQRALRGPRDAIVGSTPDVFSPPTQADGRSSTESLNEKIAEAIRVGRIEFEWEHRRLDGTTLTNLVTVSHSEFDGHSAFLVGWRDITERKLVEMRLQNAMKETEAANQSLAHSERFIRAITDAMPSLVAYWDHKLHCKFANQAYLDWWGISAQALQATSLQKLMGASLFSVNEPVICAALAGEEQHFERYLTKPDGSVGHVLAHYVPDRDASGQVVGFIIIVTDINAHKLAEAELKLAANVYQNTAEGIMVTDRNGIILSVNPAFTQITGYPAEEAVGQSPRLLRSDRHDLAFHASVWQEIAGEGRWQGEIWNRRKDGGVFLEWQTITRITGANEADTRYVSVFHDITDTWQINEDNRQLAFHDALTKLPNRALLMERLSRRILSAAREPRVMAVMFLDLDRFKVVNDTLGHAVGDELLIAVAGKLQALVRQSDTVARLGGDEFVIKLDNPANQDEVRHIADRVIAVINEPIEIGDHTVHVGASVGIAIFPSDGATAAELLKSADAAMYGAKRAGKNRYQFFDAEMGACKI